MLSSDYSELKEKTQVRAIPLLIIPPLRFIVLFFWTETRMLWGALDTLKMSCKTWMVENYRQVSGLHVHSSEV